MNWRRNLIENLFGTEIAEDIEDPFQSLLVYPMDDEVTYNTRNDLQDTITANEDFDRYGADKFKLTAHKDKEEFTSAYFCAEMKHELTEQEKKSFTDRIDNILKEKFDLSLIRTGLDIERWCREFGLKSNVEEFHPTCNELKELITPKEKCLGVAIDDHGDEVWLLKKGDVKLEDVKEVLGEICADEISIENMNKVPCLSTGFSNDYCPRDWQRNRIWERGLK